MMMPATPALFDPLMSDPKVTAIMSDQGLVARMLAFEAALARAEARTGVIPADAAKAIAEAAAMGIDMAKLATASALAGNPAIPLVRMLTEKTAKDGQRHVHWGATSQDVMDTAMVLQVRDCLEVFSSNLGRLQAALTVMAQQYRATPMVGRTLLQHALPTTFGMKTAGWLAGINRAIERLAEMIPRVLVLQFGGAAGTLASLGMRGPAVSRALAQMLGLGKPVLPWHTQRDRVAEIACFCGILTGTLGKIARDISLMSQTDVGEVMEGATPGRGGSSTMPHKRNPVSCNIILGASTAVPNLVATVLAAQVQEHERGLGNWAAEWRTLPELFRLTSGALLHACTLIEGLEINPARMRINLDATNGLVMAEAVMMELAPFTGRLAAHHLVENASKIAISENIHLREAIMRDKIIAQHLDTDALDALFEPTSYLGSVESLIDAAVKAAR
jgi:3-carboxy-cis,cis-muconate cycloisomerase